MAAESPVVTSLIWLPSLTTRTLELGMTAMFRGEEKTAFVPVPSTGVPDPLPQSVVTTPKGVTWRMRELELSATSMRPLARMASPLGLLKSAAVPVPSANPADVPDEPPPASVVTTPAGVMARMTLLLESAM